MTQSEQDFWAALCYSSLSGSIRPFRIALCSAGPTRTRLTQRPLRPQSLFAVLNLCGHCGLCVRLIGSARFLCALCVLCIFSDTLLPPFPPVKSVFIRVYPWLLFLVAAPLCQVSALHSARQ